MEKMSKMQEESERNYMQLEEKMLEMEERFTGVHDAHDGHDVSTTRTTTFTPPFPDYNRYVGSQTDEYNY